VFGSADEGGEEAFGQVFAGVACADGAAAVVDYDGRVVKVGHVWIVRCEDGGREGLRRDGEKSAGVRDLGRAFSRSGAGLDLVGVVDDRRGQVNSCQDMLKWEVFTV
jgi:hypothetical protein